MLPGDYNFLRVDAGSNTWTKDFIEMHPRQLGLGPFQRRARNPAGYARFDSGLPVCPAGMLQRPARSAGDAAPISAGFPG